MPIQPLPLSPSALFSRLAEGHAARATVLTPNRRLAQALQADFDRSRLEAGRTSWEAPDIVPFGAFVQRCHDEALYSGDGTRLPTPLGPGEVQLLWEEAIQASRWHERLLSVPATAALAAEAWELAHAWRIDGALEGSGNEDAQAFASWCSHFRRRTARDGLVDPARMPGLVAARFASGAAHPPALLVLYGFELITPQQEDFVEACVRAGAQLATCSAMPVASQLRRAVFDSPREELEHAARWARRRLEDACAGRSPRIGVVVPQLGERRSQVARIFSRVLAPDEPWGESAARLFNISLGVPLSSFPLVDAALAVLELCAAPFPFERVSRLLRSPFIGGAQAELGERARLDAALRRVAPAWLSLHRLRALATRVPGAIGCPSWIATLDLLIAGCRDDGRAPAPDWARRFTALLDAAGFPGDRPLDSVEFQVLAKWREALSAFAALGSIAPAWSAGEARSRLRRLCGETVFQTASGSAPIQVLGILESAGLAFDHLWVSGLTEEAWPLAARPHPFIAAALQRRAGIPQSTPERSLELDAALTRSWRGAAPEVVFTSARAEGDRELLASPLVADVEETPRAQLGIPEYPTRSGALFAAGAGAASRGLRGDTPAPVLAAGAMAGGTALLSDQAACPFRAFAHFRLHARALESPEPGLGPPERGDLLHKLMARLWKDLGDHATLQATDEERLSRLIDEAAAHAVSRLRAERPGRLEGRFAQLERERLARLAREWLAVERRRAPFEVRMLEERMTLPAGKLRLAGRVDRIDRLLDGGLAVIDYKTGVVSVSDWLGKRPDDAQLPLYALAAGDEEVRALAFARLRIGELGFAGLARDDGLLPEVSTVDRHPTARRQASSWGELLARWREELDALGESFASGNARVDPKHALRTCERCDLKTLCRVHERFGGLGTPDAAEVEP